MKKQIILLIAILFLPLIVVGDDCYTRTRQKAIDAYNRGEYDYAKELFQSVKEDCIETPTNNDIDSWINKCSSAKREQIKREQVQKEIVNSKDYSKGKTHEYVDLGLSVKWATCNIGANSPEECGDYFAWGEITKKKDYNWETYKYCRGTFISLTKYNSRKDRGETDYKTILDKHDDAAYIILGYKWHIPTKEELEELVSKCKWTWTTLNNVNGYKIIGPNGNSIFLPVTGGYWHGGKFFKPGLIGTYWSSSLCSGAPSYAYYLGISSNAYNINYLYDRSDGLSIRPVCK